MKIAKNRVFCYFTTKFRSKNCNFRTFSMETSDARLVEHYKAFTAGFNGKSKKKACLLQDLFRLSFEFKVPPLEFLTLFLIKLHAARLYARRTRSFLCPISVARGKRRIRRATLRDRDKNCSIGGKYG